MAKNLGISVLLDFYGSLLTEKQREVVELYYDEDLSLAEIAEHAGITRQGVRDCIKRAEFQLLDCEEKLGHVRRFSEIQQGLDEIALLARDLLDENGRVSVVAGSGDSVQRILAITSEIGI